MLHLLFILAYKRLWKLNITVGTTAELTKHSLCKFYDETVPSAGSATIVCNKIGRGNHLGIQRTTRNALSDTGFNVVRNGFLTLCEVHVDGYEGIYKYIYKYILYYYRYIYILYTYITLYIL